MKHKICIYAIARNEEQFVDRFCDAAAEADYIAVLESAPSKPDANAQRARKNAALLAGT